MGSRAASGANDEAHQEQLSGTVRRKPVPSNKSYGSWFLLFLLFSSTSHIEKKKYHIAGEWEGIDAALFL